MDKKIVKEIPNYKVWIGWAGHHSKEELPRSEEQRLYFALLEAIDWDCWDYDHCPREPTRKGAIRFLRKHRDRIRCNPPSYLGLASGAFNFLVKK